MAKRLIVCCDGTWNRPDKRSRGVPTATNVLKLALGVAREDARGTQQVLLYQQGVGTAPFERLRGGMLGFGLSRNVRDCYRFLVESYEPGDELFLFGFSRGAFTARSLAGLIRNSGILRREHAARIDEAYGLYRARADSKRPSGVRAKIFRRMYSHPDDEAGFLIRMIGVWDTVGSLGIPTSVGRLPILSRRWTFHDVKLSSRVEEAFHALAIDERRRPFRPTLWKRRAAVAGQTLEQVWFAGAHSDVGGGYAKPALSEIPLLWMVERARAAGVAFEPGHFTRVSGPIDAEVRVSGARVAPDALGELHDSRKGPYRLQPAYQRPLEADGAAVASSALRRLQELRSYAPETVEQWEESGGREVPVQGNALPEKD